MTSKQHLKNYSIFIIPILIGGILLIIFKPDRPFLMLSDYHFELVQSAKSNMHSSSEYQQNLNIIRQSFNK